MIITRPFFFFLLVLLCLPLPARAGEEMLARGQDMTVAEVLSAENLAAPDGTTLHLAGIYVPPSISVAARQWLQETVAGKTLSLWHDAASHQPDVDRYGRIMAYARMQGGAFIQNKMAELGLALVTAQDTGRNMTAPLLAAEATARKNKKGIWAGKDFTVGKADAPQSIAKGQFAIIEGTVVQAMQKKDRLYLNFGLDWKSDFTASVTPPVFRAFEDEGKTPDQWQGAHIRVRGWVENINGPLITVTRPEQIEILSNPR